MGVRLLWSVIIGFLLGVFARSLLTIGLSVAGFAALLSATVLLFGFVDREKMRPLALLAAALFAFGLGVVRMNGAVLIGDPLLSGRLDKKVVIEGIVSEEPDVRENNVRISLNTDSLAFATSTVTVHAGVLVIAPPNTSVKYGDRVRAEGTIRLPQAFEVGLVRSLARAGLPAQEGAPEGPFGRATSNGMEEGRQFNYPEYLAKDGIGYELAFAQVEHLSSGDGNAIKKSAIWIKQKFLEGLGLALNEPQAGLGGGITVGAKRGLGKDLSDTFITVGLIHVVVLSGYNIMLVMNGAAKIFSRAPRLFKLFISGFIAILFALMTGGASSSVRAASMAVIGVVGRATGRLYLATRILGIVALGMVVWNPFILAFDLGFQLSVIATLGLIWFTPIFSERLKWITEKFALREIAASTLGTQLAVLPLLLYQNGQLPLFSLPANLLALVAVPPAMGASAIASLGGLIANATPVLSGVEVIIAFPAYVLLSYIIEVAKFFSSLPFASVAVGAFSAWWMFLAYAVMFGALVFVKKRQGRDPAFSDA